MNIIVGYFIITLKLRNDFIKIQWFRSVNTYFSIIHANGEFLGLYFKSVFKKILLKKRLVFWKKNEKQNEMKFWTFSETPYTWNKCNMENVIFFLGSRTVAPEGNCPPKPNSNPNPKPNPNTYRRGRGIFYGGKCPDTIFLILPKCNSMQIQ